MSMVGIDASSFAAKQLSQPCPLRIAQLVEREIVGPGLCANLSMSLVQFRLRRRASPIGLLAQLVRASGC